VSWWWFAGVMFCFAATGMNAHSWVQNPGSLPFAVQTFMCLGSMAITLTCKPRS